MVGDEPAGEFSSPSGSSAFEDACALADRIGKPWMLSGGSELFDPATRRCWSHKTLFPIHADQVARE